MVEAGRVLLKQALRRLGDAGTISQNTKKAGQAQLARQRLTAAGMPAGSMTMPNCCMLCAWHR